MSYAASSRPAVAVVVPVYNSEATLVELVERLAPVLAGLADRYELLLVNDGSRDRSWEVVQSLAARYPWVCGIDLMRNYGQHNALLCGIRAARADVIFTMDDDLQHPPEEMPLLLARLQEGFDVVYGTPHQEQHGLARNLVSRASKRALTLVTPPNVARNISAFRVFRAELRRAFAAYESSFVSVDVLLTWATRRFSAVRVQRNPRKVGRSNYSIRRLIVHTITIVTGYSTAPLQLASLIGFAFTLFGLGVLAYVIGRYLVQGGSVPGFPFLASVIAIFSGAQLFALGILGEYIARIHSRTLGHPVAVVRESVGPASLGETGQEPAAAVAAAGPAPP